MFKKYVPLIAGFLVVAVGLFGNAEAANNIMSALESIDGWKCASCGSVHSLGVYSVEVDDFCNTCGSSSEGCSFQLRRSCSSCGSAGSFLSDFCSECGGRLVSGKEVKELPKNLGFVQVYVILAAVFCILMIFGVFLLVRMIASDIDERRANKDKENTDKNNEAELEEKKEGTI